MSNQPIKASGGPKQPYYSFLMPTRERPDMVKRFFDSIAMSTANLDDLEIILAADDDDPVSQAIVDERFHLKKIVIPKGATMGALNRACFDASCGRFVMLVNDDLIIRTHHWDVRVREAIERFEDDICLIHVNELLFREKLCTFPILSREACLRIGICKEAYERYRIDDHIYDIYCMLGHLGYPRILYLPDVVFEHDNVAANPTPHAAHEFQSADGKVYAPKQDIIARDAMRFDDSIDERKQHAKLLAGYIEDRKRQKIEADIHSKLATVVDSTSYRHPGLFQVFPSPSTAKVRRPRVTVSISTANMNLPHAKQCLESVKAHTKNFDLIVFDNNHNPNYSHPGDMNQVLDGIDTEYLVLMDDDVFVEPGWLEGMMRAMTDDVGVVVPLHKDKDGKLAFSGAHFSGDSYYSHAHLLDMPTAVRPIPCYCSAIMLIDMKKVGHIRMDRAYKKYFFDIVHGLEVWEAGYQCVVTPEVMVTHIGGATSVRTSTTTAQLWRDDGLCFANQWTKTGRIFGLEDGIWQRFPFIRELVDIPRTIRKVMVKLLDSPTKMLSSMLVATMVAYKDYLAMEGLFYELLPKMATVFIARGNEEAAKIIYSTLYMYQTNRPKLVNQSDEQMRVCRMMVQRFLDQKPAREIQVALP